MLCIQCVLPSAGTVSFNCNIEFPKNVTKLVAPLSIFNFDIFPSLGLSCNLDYNCATVTFVIFHLSNAHLSQVVSLMPFFLLFCLADINSMIMVTVMPIAMAMFLFLVNAVMGYLSSKSRDEIRKLEELYQLSEDQLGVFDDKEITSFRSTFAAYDVDYSGAVNKAELKLILEDFEQDASEANVNRIFAEANHDGDSKITFSEFIEMLHRERHERNASSFAVLAERVDFKTNKEREQSFFYLFLLLTFLVLISTSTKLFQYFKCSAFDEAPKGDPNRYLSADLSIDCDSKRYKSWIWFAVLGLLVYPVGIPLMYWTLLYEHRDILYSERAMLHEASIDFPTVKTCFHQQ